MFLICLAFKMILTKYFFMELATLLEGAGYLFSQAKFQNLLKALYGVLSVKSW